jgi:hypothetical protein
LFFVHEALTLVFVACGHYGLLVRAEPPVEHFQRPERVPQPIKSLNRLLVDLHFRHRAAVLSHVVPAPHLAPEQAVRGCLSVLYYRVSERYRVYLLSLNQISVHICHFSDYL